MSHKPVGKAVVTPPAEESGKPAVTRAQISKELPGMPAGDVPEELREMAENVVRLEADISTMYEDLKREKDKLTDKMLKHKCDVVPVIIDSRWKKKVRLKKTSGATIKVEDDGVVDDAKDRKEQKAEKRQKDVGLVN